MSKYIEIEKFLNFLDNYTYNFIEEVWGKDTTLTRHFKSKFEGDIIRFMRGLDHENLELLINYIVNK